MAVRLVRTNVKYIGLSTDIKPTAGIDHGAEFKETNTGKRFVYNGVTWVDDSVQVAFPIDQTTPGVTNGVQLTGSTLDIRGLAINKPLATAVIVGATYWSVDLIPSVVEQSNGTVWVVL